MAVYTTKLGDQICDLTANSSTGLRHICAQLGLPYSTVTNWIYDKSHEMYLKYANAKMSQLHHLAHETVEIAELITSEYMVSMKKGKKEKEFYREAIYCARLRINTRLSLISKLAPIYERQLQAKEKQTKEAQTKEKHTVHVVEGKEPDWYREKREEYEAKQKAAETPTKPAERTKPAKNSRPINKPTSLQNNQDNPSKSTKKTRSVNQSTNQQINHSSSPKKTLKALLDEEAGCTVYTNYYIPDQTRYYPE